MSVTSNPQGSMNVDWESFDIQGHRGARGLYPENTLRGFLAAMDYGVTTLEMDVVISADGVVVLSHDPFMSPETCSHPGGNPVSKKDAKHLILYQMSLAEIQAFDCGSRGHPDFPAQMKAAESKPALIDVIRTVEERANAGGNVPIQYNIETKSTPDGDGIYHPGPTDFVKRLIDTVDQVGVADRVTIQSFDERTLIAARDQEFVGDLSLLVSRGIRSGLERQLGKLPFIPDIYSPDHHLVDVRLVEQVHERGMRIIPWTVNEPPRMKMLIEIGVDGLITDYPDRLAHLISEEMAR